MSGMLPYGSCRCAFSLCLRTFCQNSKIWFRISKGENVLFFPVISYHLSIGNGSCFDFSKGLNEHVGGVPRRNVTVNNHGGAHRWFTSVTPFRNSEITYMWSQKLWLFRCERHQLDTVRYWGLIWLLWCDSLCLPLGLGLQNMSTLNQLASLTNSGGANALQGVNSAGWFQTRATLLNWPMINLCYGRCTKLLLPLCFT